MIARVAFGQVLAPSSRYYEELEPEVGDSEAWTEDDDFLVDAEAKPVSTPALDSAALVTSIRSTSTATSLAFDTVLEGLRDDDLRNVLIRRIGAVAYATAENSGGDPDAKAEAAVQAVVTESDHALAVALRRRLDALLGLLKPVVKL